MSTLRNSNVKRTLMSVQMCIVSSNHKQNKLIMDILDKLEYEGTVRRWYCGISRIKNNRQRSELAQHLSRQSELSCWFKIP